MNRRVHLIGTWNYCQMCGSDAKKHILCKSKSEYWIYPLCDSKECDFIFYTNRRSERIISKVNENSFKIINRYNYKIDLRDYAKSIAHAITDGVISKEEIFFLINKYENEAVIKDILE